jgi:chromosomal replication initiator protein
MSSQLTEIWNRTLELLKDEMTEISFNTWIKNLEPSFMNSSTIILTVNDSFNKGIIETRHAPLIKNAIAQVTKKDYELKFSVSSDENSEEEFSNLVNKNDLILTELNQKYTFNTFVVGNNNRFAHAASLAVAESPGKTYNPLFIYGGVGLGKTHLMQAIGHYVFGQNQNLKVLYVTSEKFTNELINALRDGSMEEFRNKYRNVDLLMIDDIQFIAGKERTQEEFFHTFNTLYAANKQIILTSDKPPKEITTLEERLRSRFEWGLTADIQSPDLETRIAILRKKVQFDKVLVPDGLLEYIADKFSSNIRELEGALNRIIAIASLTHNELSIDLANEALKDMLNPNRKKVIDHRVIQDAVGRYFDMKLEDFKTKKRSRDIAFPRQIAMYLCREMTDMSLPQIGDEFGGRDHTTVMHAYDKINQEIKLNQETRRAIDEIKKAISASMAN